jgi:hypothetical protein
MSTPSPHRVSILSTDIETALHRLRALFTAIEEVVRNKPNLDFDTQVIDLASMGEAICEDQLADLRTDTGKEG